MKIDPAQAFVKISDLIEVAASPDYERSSFCLYAKGDIESIRSTQECVVDNYPVVKDDVEIYPAYCQNNQLNLFYYGDQFEDVVTNAKRQKPTASVEEYISALNYYLENDDFLDLS